MTATTKEIFEDHQVRKSKKQKTAFIEWLRPVAQQAYEPLFRKIFASDHRLEADFATKHYVYPSDQSNFPVGVGVATLNKTKGGLLYMDKIHTPKDTVYRQENIQYLVEGCIRLSESLSK